MPDTRVLIVGGGIAGLTLAGLLHRRGFSNVLLVEKAKEYGVDKGYVLGACLPACVPACVPATPVLHVMASADLVLGSFCALFVCCLYTGLWGYVRA